MIKEEKKYSELNGTHPVQDLNCLEVKRIIKNKIK